MHSPPVAKVYELLSTFYVEGVLSEAEAVDRIHDCRLVDRSRFCLQESRSAPRSECTHSHGLLGLERRSRKS